MQRSTSNSTECRKQTSQINTLVHRSHNIWMLWSADILQNMWDLIKSAYEMLKLPESIYGRGPLALLKLLQRLKEAGNLVFIVSGNGRIIQHLCLLMHVRVLLHKSISLQFLSHIHLLWHTVKFWQTGTTRHFIWNFGTSSQIIHFQTIFDLCSNTIAVYMKLKPGTTIECMFFQPEHLVHVTSCDIASQN